MTFKRQKRGGQQQGNTVLEMVVALFILTVGLLAIIGLSFSNVVQTRTSLNEVQAANFAREVIEIVRNIRDSNKYKKTGSNAVRWNDRIDTEGEKAIDTVNRDLVAISGGTPGNRAIVQRSDKTYAQATSGTNTKFQRTVTLYPICSTGSTQTDDFGSNASSSCTFNATDSGIGSTIGIQVIATVKWQEDKRARQIVVEDRLYNW